MNDPAAFYATFSDWRLVKGRKVVQIVFEVPLEGAGIAYDVLGGMPDPSKEVWCAVARLNMNGSEVMLNQSVAKPAPGISGPEPDKTAPAPHPADKANGAGAEPDKPVKARKPVAADKKLAQRAGILSGDPVFWTFLFEHDHIQERSAEAATIALRRMCGVGSRAEIVPGSAAAERFYALDSKFVGWRDAG